MPLTIVRGLVGTGKTTLVADWARQRRERGYNVVWFSGSDSPGPESIDDMIRTRPDLTQAGPLVVVVDDAHHLTDEEQVKQLCELLVTHSKLHVVVCTRQPHPIGTKARERGIAMTELTGTDLDARAGELAALAELWGHELDPEEESVLFAATGGWLAPARVALDHTDPHHDPDGMLAAGRYVHERILPGMTETAPEIAALTLSLAEELTVDLVRAVCVEDPHAPGMLGPHTPESVLVDYESRGFVERIPHPSHTLAWRLPVLVRRVLADSLRAGHPQRATHTHKVMARFLVNGHNPGENGRIIHHASAAHDWGVLARMWAQHGLGMLTTHPEEVLGAYSEVPSQIMKRHPVLALAASVLTSLRKPADPHRRARTIRHYVNVGRSARQTSKQSLSGMDTGWATAQIIADRLNGHPDKALRRAEHHAQQVATGELTVGSAATWGWFELQWGMSALAGGKSATALKLFGQAIQSGRTAGADFLVAAASGQRALANAVSGHTQEVAKDLETHAHVRVSSGWLRSNVAPAAHIATGLLSLDRLDPDAHEHFDRADDGADSIDEWALLALARAQHTLLFGDPMRMMAQVGYAGELRRGLISPGGRDQTALDRTHAELLLALGEFNRAERYLNEVHEPRGLSLAVPRARLALITGDVSGARNIALESFWRHGMVLRDRAELFMIDAAAALALDNPTSASEAFTHAHSLAESIGTLIPYANLPREVLAELLEVSGIVLPGAALQAIDACREVYPQQGEIIRLTVRESAVLQAMAEEETLSEVAGRLSVSLNTVKKQSAAVYAKLGVHDRSAALLRAHQLGLFSDGH